MIGVKVWVFKGEVFDREEVEAEVIDATAAAVAAAPAPVPAPEKEAADKPVEERPT